MLRPALPVNPPAPSPEPEVTNGQTAPPPEPAGGDAPGDTLSREQVMIMHEKFRTVKHSACNALAVIMALSEMAERNPAYMEKLTKTVLSKSPQMVAELREFDDEFRLLLNALPE